MTVCPRNGGMSDRMVKEVRIIAEGLMLPSNEDK